MTRTKASLVGLLCGLFVGPFVGSFEVALFASFSEPQNRSAVLFFPLTLYPFAILMFGLPGALGDAVSGWTVQAIAPKLKSRSQIIALSALIGTVLASIAVETLDVLRLQIDRGFMLLAGSSGLLTGIAFGVWFSRPDPPTTVS
jgi:hypothetical protein